MSTQLQYVPTSEGFEKKPFDKDKLKEICAQRKSDYGALDIFAFQREGVFDEKIPKRRNAEEAERPGRCRGHLSWGGPYSHARQSRHARKGGVNVQAVTHPRSRRHGISIARLEEADVNLYRISVSPKRKSKGKKAKSGKTSPVDPPKHDEIARTSLKMKSKKSATSSKKSTASSVIFSIGSNWDPNLLETTGDEDFIFHAPYPFKDSCNLNSTYMHAPAQEPEKEVPRRESDPDSLSHLDIKKNPRSRSADFTCRGSILHWVASKLCKIPETKHQ